MHVAIRKADERDFKFIFALIKEFSLYQKTPEKVTLTLEQLIAEKDIFNVWLQSQMMMKSAALQVSFLLITLGQVRAFASMICM